MVTGSTTAVARLLRDLDFEPVRPQRMRRAPRSYRLQDLGDGKGFRTNLPPAFCHDNQLEHGDEPVILYNQAGLVILDYSDTVEVDDGSD